MRKLCFGVLNRPKILLFLIMIMLTDVLVSEQRGSFWKTGGDHPKEPGTGKRTRGRQVCFAGSSKFRVGALLIF